MQGPMMMMDNPYAAEVVTARQRIGRLKGRLAHRAAARRDFFADGAMQAEAPPADEQACPLKHWRFTRCLPIFSRILSAPYYSADMEKGLGDNSSCRRHLRQHQKGLQWTLMRRQPPSPCSR